MIYPWQTQAWQTIYNAYQQQRLVHALLLTGAKGLGKVNFARNVAQLLLCQAVHGQFACGHCRGCHLFQTGNHPDFSEITLLDASKQIKIEQIRQLREQLVQTAHAGGYQVVLLFPANQLHRAAANALLKTLEEPVGQVVLLLVADQLGTLPATILSRCQQILFHCSETQLATDWLSKKVTNPATAQLFLTLADLAPLRAHYLASNNYVALRDYVLQQLTNIHRQQQNPLVGVDSLLKFDLELLLYAFITIIMDILRLQYRVSASAIYNQDCHPALQVLATEQNSLHLGRMLTTLTELQQRHVSQANLNWQMAIEKLLLQWEARS